MWRRCGGVAVCVAGAAARGPARRVAHAALCTSARVRSDRVPPDAYPDVRAAGEAAADGLGLQGVPGRGAADRVTASTWRNSLRAGLAARDLDLVWDAWAALEQAGRLSMLARHDFADILALVRSLLARQSDCELPRDTRSRAWADRCRAWGTSAAERFDLLGVQGWMRIELLCGRPEGALAVFHAYHAARRRASQRVQHAHAEGVVFLDNRAGRRGQVHAVLELVVLAYAHTGELRGLVDTMQSFDVGTHTELFFNLARCRRLYAKFPWWDGAAAARSARPTAELAAVRQRALDYVSHAELARGLRGGTGAGAGRNRIARLLGSLLTRKDVSNFWRLFCTAMDAGVLASAGSGGAAEAHHWLAQAELAPPGGWPLPAWTDSCWNVALGGLLAAERTDLAAHVWAALAVVQRRVCPGERVSWPPMSVWNAVLDGFSRGGDYAAVRATWTRLSSRGAPGTATPLDARAAAPVRPLTDEAPDMLCTTTVIAAAFRGGDVATALTLFRALEAQQARGALRIPVETYNAVVHGLCYVGRSAQAQELLRTMGTGSVPAPTITTVNVLLRAQGRARQLGAMAATLRLISPLGLQPDVITFTTVLDALLRASRDPSRGEAAVAQVMNIMHSLDVPPNSVTFTAMIKACLQTRAEGAADAEGLDADAPSQPRIDVALQLLHTMNTSRLAPTIVTYTTVLPSVLDHAALVAQLAAAHRLPPAFAECPRAIAALGETPAVVEAALPLAPATAGLRVALVLLQHMERAGIARTRDVYHMMLRALLTHARNEVALRRGIALADELFRMHGRLVAALAPGGAAPRWSAPLPDATTLPTAADWTLVLRLLLRCCEQAPPADRLALQRVVHAALDHYHASEVGGRSVRAHGADEAALLQAVSDAAQAVEPGTQAAAPRA